MTDGTNSANLNFNGSYTLASFHFTTDGSGGTILYDPPIVSDTDMSAARNSTTTTNNAIIASVPNEVLTGNGGGNAFVFNFAGVGQDKVNDFHPETDTLKCSSAIFTTLQNLLDTTHDDGHGNTVIDLDSHDTILLKGVLKAELSAVDFHLV